MWGRLVAGAPSCTRRSPVEAEYNSAAGCKPAPQAILMGMPLRRALAVLMLCTAAFAARPPAKTKRAPLTADQRAAQAMMRSMSLRDRVAQLVIGVCYGDAPGKKSKLYESYRHWVRDLHIGGLIVNNRVQNGLV